MLCHVARRVLRTKCLTRPAVQPLCFCFESVYKRGERQNSGGVRTCIISNSFRWGTQEHALLTSVMQNCFRVWGGFGDMNCRALQNKLNASRQSCLASGAA